jgi:hypothetical protein
MEVAAKELNCAVFRWYEPVNFVGSDLVLTPI